MENIKKGNFEGDKKDKEIDSKEIKRKNLMQIIWDLGNFIREVELKMAKNPDIVSKSDIRGLERLKQKLEELKQELQRI
jgi:hypothetical protein